LLTTCVPKPLADGKRPSSGNPNAPVSVHAKLSGLSPGATYHSQLVDVTRNLTGGDQSFTTPLSSCTAYPASGR
jgi:hypothetical protein